jgi:hypothetical protein
MPTSQKTVDIELGGKVRTMRLDLNALCGLAEEGQDIESLKVLLVAGKTSLLTVRLMLWAFLITDAEVKNESPFTKKTVGGWIDSDNMAYCGQTLAKFITALPKAENPTQAGKTGLTALQ